MPPFCNSNMSSFIVNELQTHNAFSHHDVLIKGCERMTQINVYGFYVKRDLFYYNFRHVFP